MQFKKQIPTLPLQPFTNVADAKLESHHLGSTKQLATQRPINRPKPKLPLSMEDAKARPAEEQSAKQGQTENRPSRSEASLHADGKVVLETSQAAWLASQTPLT